MKDLKGAIALIPTPLTEDGKVDEFGLRKIIDYDMKHGCSGVGVLAAIGEGYLFPNIDVKKIIKIAASHMDGKGPLIVGCPAMGTLEAVEKCKQAEELGADAILAFNPKYKGLAAYGNSELVDHYIALTDAVKIPILPYSQADDIVPYDVLKQLVDGKRVSYMKYGWHDCELLKKLVKNLGDKLFIFVGADTFTLRLLLLGAKGISTATAAIFPEENSTLLSIVQSGDIERARRYYNDNIVPWNDCGFYQNWQVAHKLVLKLLGIIESTRCLPPLTYSLPDYQVEEIRWLLKYQKKSNN